VRPRKDILWMVGMTARILFPSMHNTVAPQSQLACVSKTIALVASKHITANNPVDRMTANLQNVWKYG
jgi:hypothetical protein